MAELIVDDVNVLSEETLINPNQLKESIPASADALATVARSRTTIREILDRNDPRLLVVIGPCSIHDVDCAMDYASRLKKLAVKFQNRCTL